MARHVLSVKGVCRAFVSGDVNHARNAKQTIWFDDHDTLYSYNLPIAWRNQHGAFLVRDSWDTVTTQTHISTVSHFDSIYIDVDELERRGVDRDDIIGEVKHPGYRVLYFTKGKDQYALFKITDTGKGGEEGVAYTRNVTPLHFCIKGDIDVLQEDGKFVPENFTRTVLPRKYLLAAYDGWVSYTGDWFFIAKPEVDTRAHPETITPWPSFEGDYRATEGLGDLVRGVVYKDDKTMLSFNTDVRPVHQSTWYARVRPTILPLKRGDLAVPNAIDVQRFL